MPGKDTLLIVDDSPDDIRFLMENLKEDYSVLVATSGLEALETAKGNADISVILLDVTMPELDGYTTCEQLKTNPDTRHMDVIFVTASSTLEEKLRGYDLGASDYLIKPVSPEELKKKVKLTTERRRSQTKNQLKTEHAMQVAKTAMLDAGNQGVIMNFLRESFRIRTVEDLGRLVINSVARFDLDSSAQLRSGSRNFNCSSREPVTPLEAELLDMVRNTERMITHGRRLVINFGNITLLVKNMPEDEMVVGRLRDHLALLMESASSRLGAISHHVQVRQLVQHTLDSMGQALEIQKDHRTRMVNITDEIKDKLQPVFVAQDLSDSQEEAIMNVVDDGHRQALSLFEHSKRMDSLIRTLLEQLRSAGPDE